MRARADRRRLPVARALAGAARDGVRRARDPVRPRGPRPARADAVRRRRSLPCSASPGSAAAARELFALPALAVLRPPPRPASTSSRAGCAAARSHSPERVAEETEKLRAAPLPALEALRGGRDAGRGGPRACAAVDAPRRVRARRRRGPERRRARTCAPTRRSRGCSTSSRAGRRSAATLDARGRRRGARAARPCSVARAGGAGRVAVLDLLRARTRALRRRLRARARGGEPAAARARPRRSSTTSARAAPRRRACSAPDPVARDRYLFYTACTRATRAALPRPRGGDRRGQPARAEPVLGRGARASSRPTTSPAGRAAARSRR